MTEQLTDEEWERIRNGHGTEEDGIKAVTLIDAHAADRAALVAQLEAAELASEDANDYLDRAESAEQLLRKYRTYFAAPGDSVFAQAAVKDIDAVLAGMRADTHAAEGQRDRGNTLEAQVARLTEALAAAELRLSERAEAYKRAEAAKARARELEARAANAAEMLSGSAAFWASEVLEAIRG